jgi:alkylglycerol monooxygenase
MIDYLPFFIPFFLLIVVAEWYISHERRDHNYKESSTVNNIAIGAIDQLGSVFIFIVMLFILYFFYDNFRLIDLKTDYKHWIFAFIAVDFVTYWYHRFSHRVNILWAGHITHHSSGQFNLTTGFRVSVFQGLNRIVFWLILPVLGLDPLISLTCFKITGIWTFLLHTNYIGKLGFLEHILVTPSLHRVHHGRNDLYIDKNYGQFFIVWDKLFKTYQVETEKVEYGIKARFIDNNPITAITHQYTNLFQRIKSTARLKDKIKLCLMPPERLPPDTMQYFQSSSKLRNTDPSKPIERKYAGWLLVSGIPVLMTFLAYIKLLPSDLLIVGIVYIIWTFALSAMIISNNRFKNLWQWEFLRLAAFGTVFGFVHQDLPVSNLVMIQVIGCGLFLLIFRKLSILQENKINS